MRRACPAGRMSATITLVEEAKRTLDQARRKELYTEAWNIVNVELPHFHLHELTTTSAAAKAGAGLPALCVLALHLSWRWHSHGVYRDVVDYLASLDRSTAPLSGVEMPWKG